MNQAPRARELKHGIRTYHIYLILDDDNSEAGLVRIKLGLATLCKLRLTDTPLNSLQEKALRLAREEMLDNRWGTDPLIEIEPTTNQSAQ